MIARDRDDADRKDRQRQALAVPTRRRIFELIAGAPDPMSVAGLAAACDVHVNTVRLHLAVLVDVGLVAQSLERSPGRGRPGYRYRSLAAPPADTPEGHGADDYRQLAGWLAAAVRTGSTARATGRRIGATEMQQQAGEDPRTATYRAFARLGFAPRWITAPAAEHAAMLLQACPFAAVAADDPDTVCSLHLGIAEGMTAADTTVVVEDLDVASRPTDGGCRLRMRTVPPASRQ